MGTPPRRLSPQHPLVWEDRLAQGTSLTVSSNLSEIFTSLIYMLWDFLIFRLDLNQMLAAAITGQQNERFENKEILKC